MVYRSQFEERTFLRVFGVLSQRRLSAIQHTCPLLRPSFKLVCGKIPLPFWVLPNLFIGTSGAFLPCPGSKVLRCPWRVMANCRQFDKRSDLKVFRAPFQRRAASSPTRMVFAGTFLPSCRWQGAFSMVEIDQNLCIGEVFRFFWGQRSIAVHSQREFPWRCSEHFFSQEMPIRRSKNLSLLAHIPLADAFLWSFQLQDPLSIMIIWQIQFVSTCLFTLFILAGKFRFLCEPCPLAVNLQRGLSWHPLTVFGAPLQRKAASKKLFQPSQQTGFFLRRLCGVVSRTRFLIPCAFWRTFSLAQPELFFFALAWNCSDFLSGSKPIEVDFPR